MVTDGLKGFATQGVLPEMMRATYMRVLKFFLFPITHKAMFGRAETKGNPGTKVRAIIHARHACSQISMSIRVHETSHVHHMRLRIVCPRRHRYFVDFQ